MANDADPASRAARVPSPVETRTTRLADGREVSGRDLAPLVYEDLRRLAHHLFLRERPGITIQPTALVHEAYLRLADQKEEGWENRAQFMAVAAVAMRRILTSAARSRGRLKRGSGMQRVTLSGHEPEQSEASYDLLDLEEALEALAGIKERYAQIAELRYFAGLTLEEVAEVLGVTRTVIDRDWAKARAYLALRLGERDERPG